MTLPGLIESGTVNESRSPSTISFSKDILDELSEGVDDENSSLESNRKGTSANSYTLKEPGWKQKRKQISPPGVNNAWAIPILRRGTVVEIRGTAEESWRGATEKNKEFLLKMAELLKNMTYDYQNQFAVQELNTDNLLYIVFFLSFVHDKHIVLYLPWKYRYPVVNISHVFISLIHTISCRILF